MWDVGCVAGSVAFFAIALGYVEGCLRLGAGDAVTMTAGAAHTDAPVKTQSREKR